MSYRYLGYGITDSNGEAKLEYDENGNHLDHSITGTGAGELDIVASLDKPTNEDDDDCTMMDIIPNNDKGPEDLVIEDDIKLWEAFA